jgi:ABC-2 type transport system ATP-binding protein
MQQVDSLPPDAMLSVHGLSFSYGGKPAVDDVSFTLRSGTFTALLGHNGAGKTTLFSLLLRLLAPPPGKVLIAGHDVASKPSLALAPVGVVFQEPTLDLDLTVRQNLSYFGALRGMAASEIAAQIAHSLAAANLIDAMDKRVRMLSGGQRRRIEIARAMLHGPEILLLDEPTTGLDVPSRKAIVAQVHALSRQTGVTVLWATHIIDEVEASDDVIVLHDGRVVANGARADVIAGANAADLGSAYHALTVSPPGAKAA